MKRDEYFNENVQVLNVKDVITKRPEMYFGSRGINPEAIATNISSGALVLGAKKY